MKYAKAIEILKDLLNINLNYYCPDRKDAIKQSIEALLYCQKVRAFPHLIDRLPLPSEL